MFVKQIFRKFFRKKAVRNTPIVGGALGVQKSVNLARKETLFLRGDEGGLRSSLVDKQEELYSFQRAKV